MKDKLLFIWINSQKIFLPNELLIIIFRFLDNYCLEMISKTESEINSYKKDFGITLYDFNDLKNEVYLNYRIPNDFY